MSEQSREFAQKSIQHWFSDEVFSFGWFLMIGILIIFYVVWFKLLDKKRAGQLLLIGALAAVFFHENIMIMMSIFGFFDYTIRIIPVHTPAFASSVTLCPIILMLVQQYTSSWKGYMLWSGIGMAILNFGIFELYVAVGILEFHNWNIFFHFIALFVIAQFTRLIFLWIVGTQKRYREKAKMLNEE